MGPVVASFTSTLNTGSAVVAPVAALGAVAVVSRTVRAANAGRRESHAAHEEEMRELHDERKAAAERHVAEVRQRAAAFEADLALRRLAQLEAISALVLLMVDVARQEYLDPPKPVDVTEGFRQMVTTTRIPAIRIRLQTAIEVFNKLGGTKLDVRLPQPGRGEQVGSMRVWGDGVDILSAIDDLVGREQSPRELSEPDHERA